VALAVSGCLHHLPCRPVLPHDEHISAVYKRELLPRRLHVAGTVSSGVVLPHTRDDAAMHRRRLLSRIKHSRQQLLRWCAHCLSLVPAADAATSCRHAEVSLLRCVTLCCTVPLRCRVLLPDAD
jgi:hypothetical protein